MPLNPTPLPPEDATPEPLQQQQPSFLYGSYIASEDTTPRPRVSGSQVSLIALILAITIGSVVYRVVQHMELGHSALLFVGLPAVLAIALAMTPHARSATGAICKGITLFLLIVAPLLGEGMICILFAAPIFYAVGILVGVIVDYFRRKRMVTLACVTVLLAPMCLEGVVPAMTLAREQTVSVTRVVDAPAAEVEQSLAASPAIAQPMPWLLRLGFPVPLAAGGQGLELGDERRILFSGVEGHAPGTLRLRVVNSGAGFADMQVIEDGSKLDSWLHWQGSSARWQALDAHHTSVTWTMTYSRQLDPAWYFGPLERETMRQAAVYMIRSNTMNSNAQPASVFTAGTSR